MIMSLDAEAIACCRDLIAEPDMNKPYTKLKQRIIENFSVSAENQLRQLIKGQVRETVADPQSTPQFEY